MNPTSGLIVICGVSFSGKSTLAKAIISRFGYEEIDVDDVGAKLYNVNVNDERLKHLDWDLVYDEADRLIETRLKSGATVVDASRNFTMHERERARQVAKRSNAQLVTIFVDTPEEIARQRRLRNRTSQFGATSLMSNSTKSSSSWNRQLRKRGRSFFITATTLTPGFPKTLRDWVARDSHKAVVSINRNPPNCCVRTPNSCVSAQGPRDRSEIHGGQSGAEEQKL